MPFVAHRVRPTQVVALFGQKVEEGLQGGYPVIDARPLLVNESVKIAPLYVTPGFRAGRHELVYIAEIVDWRAAFRKAAPQVLFELDQTFVFVHALASVSRSIPAQTNSV